MGEVARKAENGKEDKGNKEYCTLHGVHLLDEQASLSLNKTYHILRKMVSGTMNLISWLA